MSSLIMQVAIIPKPTNCLHNFNFITNSSKLRRRLSLNGGLQPRCSLQLTHKHADDEEIERRSGGYKPSLWDFDTIQSLNSEYKEERHQRRAASLIEQVKKMLVREEVGDHVRLLELIDDLHWLGISSHFKNEITQILNSTHLELKFENEPRDLYSTSLGFRLLRQHGFRVPQEVFDCFKNEKGDFKTSLGEDIKGLLQLYEASFLLTPGEETLEEAREFAATILHKKIDDHQIDDENLLSSIRAALKLPSHWRIQIPNARSYIDAYKGRADMNPTVLELAKLDTNIVQAQYQEDLKEAARWWKDTKLVQHLPFARDRMVECYSWSIGFVQPRHRRYERIMMARVNALITTIDDVFDVYGTLEELQLFTDAIRRWDDIESIKQLPKYMQLCYLALYNFVNEMAYDALKEKGFNSAPYLRKAWGDLVESYIKEANWFYSGNKPSLEEYLNNAWISIGAVQIISHIYFWVTDPLEEEGAQIMHKYHDLVRASSMILRLADDMGTSLDEVERGDVPKSIQCYMNDNNASEEEARVHVRALVAETWKTVNAEMMSDDSPFSDEFIAAAANVGRMAQFMYQDELDGFGMQNSKVHKLLGGLLFEHYT